MRIDLVYYPTFDNGHLNLPAHSRESLYSVKTQNGLVYVEIGIWRLSQICHIIMLSYSGTFTCWHFCDTRTMICFRYSHGHINHVRKCCLFHLKVRPFKVKILAPTHVRVPRHSCVLNTAYILSSTVNILLGSTQLWILWFTSKKHKPIYSTLCNGSSNDTNCSKGINAWLYLIPGMHKWLIRTSYDN